MQTTTGVTMCDPTCFPLTMALLADCCLFSTIASSHRNVQLAGLKLFGVMKRLKQAVGGRQSSIRGRGRGRRMF